jgi:hypothetical protein
MSGLDTTVRTRVTLLMREVLRLKIAIVNDMNPF